MWRNYANYFIVALFAVFLISCNSKKKEYNLKKELYGNWVGNISFVNKKISIDVTFNRPNTIILETPDKDSPYNGNFEVVTSDSSNLVIEMIIPDFEVNKVTTDTLIFPVILKFNKYRNQISSKFLFFDLKLDKKSGDGAE